MDAADRQALFWGMGTIAAVLVGSLLAFWLGLTAGMVGALAMIAIAISARFPRLGLGLFLIYLPFAGTITYAIGSVYQAIGGHVTYNTPVYSLFHLAKDAFYFPALIALAVASQADFLQLQAKIRPLLGAIVALVLVCLGTFFWVNLPQQWQSAGERPWLMGILGLKTWLGYIPLLFCGYVWLRNRRDLRFLLRLQGILALICCVLCFIQFGLLITGICAGNSTLPEPATYRASLQAQCFVGGSLLYNPQFNLIRLPGTFVSPWQWAWFLIASSFWVGGGFLQENQRRWQFLFGVSLLGLLVAALISGQRTALLLVPLVVLGVLLLSDRRRPHLLLKLGIAGCSLGVVLRTGLVSKQIETLTWRWQNTPPLHFIFDQWRWAIANHLHWLGNGLGRANSAARRLGKIELIEAFHAQVLYEIGILGICAFLILMTLLTIQTWQAYRSLSERPWRQLGLCLWLFILLISFNPHYYPLAVDPVSVYYWFLAGVLLRLPDLAAQAPSQITPIPSSRLSD